MQKDMTLYGSFLKTNLNHIYTTREEKFDKECNKFIYFQHESHTIVSLV